MRALLVRRWRLLLSTAVAMAVVVWQPAQILAQTGEISTAVPPRSLALLVERVALRLARSSVAARQLPPGNQPSSGPNCWKGKGAIIGACGSPVPSPENLWRTRAGR